MPQDISRVLTERIYDAAVDPASWTDVLALARDSFDSDVECLYSLDYSRQKMQPIAVAGISQRFLDSFERSFYTDDNPSTRSPALHQPGVVRTDQRLGEYFGDAGILKRSRYYNEWLRPQHLAHTLGMTPFARNGVVFNLTLLRSSQSGPFRAKDIARFEQLQTHLGRALRLSLRLKGATEHGQLSSAALDSMAQSVIFVTEQGRVIYCNSAAEKLLRRGKGLALRSGRLWAGDPPTQQHLSALLRRNEPARESVVVCRGDDESPLIVWAVPLSQKHVGVVAPQPTVMLLIRDAAEPRAPATELLCRLYRLTPAEARLARALVAGGGLRRAAAAADMSYETARWYLKLLFQKTSTSRQADLVARLLSSIEGEPLH